MNDLTPVLLRELRKQNKRIDWRRDSAAPLMKTWSEVFLNEAALWSEADRAEGNALLGKLSMQLTQALISLCDLVCLDQERVRWAREEISAIFSDWNLKVVQHMTREGDIDVALGKILDSLRKVLLKFPKDRVFNRSFAIVLKERYGYTLAIEHLEFALLKGAPLADILCLEISRSLRNLNHPNNVRYACHISHGLQELFSLDWPALNLTRTVAFSSLLKQSPAPAWLLLIDLSVVERQADISGCVRSICEFLVGLPVANSAKILRRIADVDIFWLSSLPKAEEARLEIVEFSFKLLEKVDRTTDVETTLKILLTLHACVPRTLKFWSDAAWREWISKKIVEFCDFIEPPHKNMIKSRYFFVLEDYQNALEEHARYSSASPTTRGPASYIDHRQVVERDSVTAQRWPKTYYKILNEGLENDEPLIIISANDRYFRLYLKNYLEKACKLWPIGRLHIHLFGYSQDVEGFLIKNCELIPKYRVTFSFEEKSITHPYFYASGRFLRLQEWCIRFRGPLILTDIDNHWGQSRSEPPSKFLKEKLAGADVGLDLRSTVVPEKIPNSSFLGYRYPAPDPWHAVWAGKFFLSGSPHSIRFAKIVSTLTDSALNNARDKLPDSN